MSNSRHPYTYAADYIRCAAGCGSNGAKISRSDASSIRAAIAKAIGMDDTELAIKLSIYYQDHEDEITKQTVEALLRNGI